MSGYLYATHFFMQLVIDFGNSLQKYAVFSGDEIIASYADEKLSDEKIIEICGKFPISDCILASVIHHTVDFEKFLKAKFNTIILDHETPLPILNNYETPLTLGKDRLACAVGAWKKFPGEHVLAIDAGTCIKYDFVSAEGVYLGGAISPGLNMRFKALHNYTGKLPLLNADMLKHGNISIIGDSTHHSILSGVGIGALLEVEGAINKYKESYGNLQVVLTGGDAPFFENHLKSRIFALPNLVLHGLHVILDHNLKNN
ncbi:MAG: type III pantothenate kinase [Chitinophagales bacterium]